MTAPTRPPANKSTVAFEVQSVISFGIGLIAVIIAVWNVPADPWIRGFLAVGILYLVTATFTLAKVIRDRQESATVLNRVDQARLEKLLADHDPFKVDR